MVEAVMLPGGRDVDVVGESYYQANLDRVCGGKTRVGHFLDCVAVLYPERDNSWDRNAVAVYIDDLKVGHLSREAAVTYRPVADRLGVRLALCRATVSGGWDRGNGDTGHYGVRLDLAGVTTCLRVLDATAPPPPRKRMLSGAA